jgi:NADH:ubiquinone oxidoreductase subunit E
MTLPPPNELAVLDDILASTPAEPEQLLPVLLEVQARIGFVSQPAIRYLAHAFNLSRAEVYGVVTFYHDLREAPVGETIVQLCMAEACQAVGCRELAAHAQQRLGVALGCTTEDGRVHVEATYCLGNCALGPSIRIGDAVYGRVTPERFDTLLARGDVMSGSTV